MKIDRPPPRVCVFIGPLSFSSLFFSPLSHFLPPSFPLWSECFSTSRSMYHASRIIDEVALLGRKVEEGSSPFTELEIVPCLPSARSAAVGNQRARSDCLTSVESSYLNRGKPERQPRRGEHREDERDRQTRFSSPWRLLPLL